MSRIHSHRLSSLFAPQRSRKRRIASRSRVRTFEVLEPRTLLSNWYVNSANSGTADGSTPATGYTTIQAAISSAGTGDTILVETGDGYNETDTVAVANLTIEADAGQAPVVDGTTPTAQTSAGFTINANTTGATIAGLTIQNFSGSSAIVVQNGASLTLSSDVIQRNFQGSMLGRGGGVFDSGGNVNITGGTLSHNSAYGAGGGIADVGGDVTISRATLSHNFGGEGGGIYLQKGTLTITKSTLSDNTADEGGGIFDSHGVDLKITGCALSDNFAGTHGGGIFDLGSSAGRADVTITGGTLSHNTAHSGGGGIYLHGGAVTITQSTLSDNTASEGGGILEYPGGDVKISGGALRTTAPARLAAPSTTMAAAMSPSPARRSRTTPPASSAEPSILLPAP